MNWDEIQHMARLAILCDEGDIHGWQFRSPNIPWLESRAKGEGMTPAEIQASATQAQHSDEGDIHDQYSWHFWDVQLEAFARLIVQLEDDQRLANMRDAFEDFIHSPEGDFGEKWSEILSIAIVRRIYQAGYRAALRWKA
jgi:hypothetical protein